MDSHEPDKSQLAASLAGCVVQVGAWDSLGPRHYRMTARFNSKPTGLRVGPVSPFPSISAAVEQRPASLFEGNIEGPREFDRGTVPPVGVHVGLVAAQREVQAAH